MGFQGATIDMSLQLIDYEPNGSGSIYYMIGTLNSQTDISSSNPVACLQQVKYKISAYPGMATMQPVSSQDFNYQKCSQGSFPQPYGYVCTIPDVDHMICKDTLECINIHLTRN